MTEFKDLTERVNRLYLDLREAERQRDENLAKVLALQATVMELEANVAGKTYCHPNWTEINDMPGKP